MNLKMVLSISLVALIGVGMITFGYTVYAIHLSHAAAITTHVIPLGIQLAIQVIQLALAGIVLYKT